MTWLLLAKRFWKPLAIIGAVIGLYLWHISAVSIARHQGVETGRAEIRAENQKAKDAADQEAAEKRAQDQKKDEKAAADLESIRNSYKELLAHPPKPETLVKYVTVKPDAQNNCLVNDFSDDFRLRYNTAASLQAGTPAAH